MEIKAVDHSVNIVGVEKNGRKYAMCVAWATQVAEDKLICAIGPQSATGRAIAAGDIIGFSNLTKAQIPVAFQLGDAFTNILFPTSGEVLAALAICKVPFNKWVKFLFPLFIIWWVISFLFIMYAVKIGF